VTEPACPVSPATPSTVRADLHSGFLVFAIAVPVCPAIVRTSDLPPIPGIGTVVLGRLMAAWLSHSQLTTKGPTTSGGHLHVTGLDCHQPLSAHPQAAPKNQASRPLLETEGAPA
jgi:MFS superfamily sulfate permease-like transporter